VLVRLTQHLSQANLESLTRILASVQTIYELETGRVAIPIRGRQVELKPINPRGSKGGVFLKTVQWAIARLERRFTVAQIYDLLVRENYVFDVKKPKLAISDSLRILKRKGHISEASSGRGRRETVYERIVQYF